MTATVRKGQLSSVHQDEINKDRFRVIPAAYLILRKDDHVLLQLRSNTGYRDGHWATGAAGHVEQGEPVHRAACREAFEELGIEVEESNLEPLTTLHRTNREPDRLPGGLDERVDFFFTTKHWKGKPRIMEPEKAVDLDWFGLDALPEPVVPHELQVLMALRAALHGNGAVRPIMTHGW